MIYEVVLKQNIKYTETTVFRFNSLSDATTFARLAIMGEEATLVTIEFIVDKDEDEDKEDE